MSDEVVQTPFGKFLIAPEDLIGSTTKAGTLWDGPGFLQVIAKEHGRLGEAGTTILDVGANIGTFTVWLAAHGAWRVVAVEPVPEVMRYLKANLDLNQAVCAGTVITLEVAAYNRRTRLVIPALDRGNLGGTALQPGWEGAGTQNRQVNFAHAECLDHYRAFFGQRVSLIKIDAQGCDGRAIEGLQETILQDHPAIVFEWEAELARAHGDFLPEFLLRLTTWGYATWEWPSHPNNYLALWQAPKPLSIEEVVREAMKLEDR